jgi:acetyl esterase/lipase
MKKFFLISIFYIMLLKLVSAQPKELQVERFVYKKIDTIALTLDVYRPVGFEQSKTLPVIVFFFGGGWVSGNIKQFVPQAKYFASRGMISILADYRVQKRNNTTPFDAVMDAKSAIRFIRKNAAKLRIDPNKIIASGGSAGGHLAAATATLDGFNDPADDYFISPVPNALVLFNPVFDNGPTGYGYDRIGDRYKEFSPIENIKKGVPPAIIFFGTKDIATPVKTAELFKKKMEDVGSRCDLFLYEGQKHGFFNYDEKNLHYYKETVYQADKFLISLGYSTGEPTIKREK